MNALPPVSKSLRWHIAFFGRRNAGKSSLLNALTQQQVSIVSPVPGTTTDPVEKPMELQPIGPVVFIDTAGLDDQGSLGEARVERSWKVLERADIALLVSDGTSWSDFEETFCARAQSRGLPVVVALNKADLHAAAPTVVEELRRREIGCVVTSAATGQGIAGLREALVTAAQSRLSEPPPLLADLVPAGEMAVLVVPIDKEAPKGRLILPQVQAIRELLDQDALCLVVKERELRHALARLTSPPRLVVTDSQAFLKVAADTPPGTLLTSFSILFARAKGDLTAQVDGALASDRLRPGDRVLIAEACTHHPVGEDIGRVKIPRWLTQRVGGALNFQHVQGRDFPEDLFPYKLVIHCGACMWNRQSMQARIQHCRHAGVPVTNYGIIIAHSLGILERALSPFPAALDLVRSHRENTCFRPGIGAGT